METYRWKKNHFQNATEKFHWTHNLNLNKNKVLLWDDLLEIVLKSLRNHKKCLNRQKLRSDELQRWWFVYQKHHKIRKRNKTCLFHRVHAVYWCLQVITCHLNVYYPKEFRITNKALQKIKKKHRTTQTRTNIRSASIKKK